ncbi:diguanylate cyclase [Uliginosibacterium sp. H3]|uniref:diguanylate cyclase n=1 Tax=Uliginosibacterium silvisoli TaxID=3114758 RepID=A0ABU6K4Z9_9RHOO|nr:diguanylate cyclase [Uliginosibacterium sp. H3]
MAPPINTAHFEQLKASGDLPSPKGVALAIMRLTSQDDVSMAELARIIRTDPAFVGRLIKAANGVIGYGRRPIASVQDALTVLGMPAIRTMALGFSLMTNYKSGACEAFDYADYWSSCLAAAVTTQAVCMRTRAAAPDETYCLGLLASVGELALATLYPKEYAEVLREVKAKPGLQIIELESRRFGMNHAELGAAMLADWGMPRVFTEAAYHSDGLGDCPFPDGSRERTLTEALMIARTMGELCLTAEAARPPVMRRLLQLGSRLSFDESSTVELCDGVAREWVEWGVLLNVKAEALPPFEQMRRQAAQVDEVPAEQEAPSDPVAVKAPEPVAPVAEAIVRPLVAPAPEPAGLSVLLASADEAASAALRQLLLNAGYKVAIVRDVSMAAEFALDYEPDIFVVDWALTDKGGEESIRAVRETRIGRGMFIVILSERRDEEFMVRAYGLGVDDVLSKPVSPRLLLARLEAGKRVTTMHSEIERDREEIRHFAAELAVSNRRLQEVAMMDPLTGFPNRRFFVDRLLQEWAASTRNKRPLSCVIVDVDNFRIINDTYGHEVGDSVLRQISTAMRDVLRSHDVVARTGGDEFLVMCPDTPLEAAQACAERLRAAVEGAEIVSGMLNLKLTVSVGLAARDASIGDTDALVRRAEQGLQTAKQAGRNRVSGVQLRPHVAGA